MTREEITILAIVISIIVVIALAMPWWLEYADWVRGR